ncbi:MAG: IS110 family transposase [Steroidobacteraceae bacterium]
MSIYAGIDIAARSFVLAWREAGRPAGTREFAQSPAGHAEAAALLSDLAPERVVLEATGVYYLDLACALAEAGLPVAVINPKRFHHFAQLRGAPSKTDPLDAALLAEYGQCLRPPRWHPPGASHQALRAIGRRVGRLTHARAQAKNRLHALRATRTTPALLIADEQTGIKALDERIKYLSAAAEKLIAAEPALARMLEHVQSAKGIGLASAVTLIAELAVLPAHLKANQVSRHAGLDVRLTQSGTSVNKPGRLSKSGNAYLRTALYMPALSAVRYDPYARAFYQALLARGKKKIQALCAVMRKYLTGLWACLKAAEPFDSSRLFSSKHLNQA